MLNSECDDPIDMEGDKREKSKKRDMKIASPSKNSSKNLPKAASSISPWLYVERDAAEDSKALQFNPLLITETIYQN